MTKAATPRRLSGFCNPTLPRTEAYDPHRNCRLEGCCCACHLAPRRPPPQEPTVPDPEPATDFPCCDPPAADEPEAPLPQALALVHTAAAALDAAAGGLEAVPWVEALEHLRDLRRALDTLRKIDAMIVRHAYLTGEHGKRVIDGLGEVWVGRGRSKERWQSQEAVVAYVEQKIAAQDGEVPGPDQLLEWVAEVVPLTQSTSLRVTPLRSVGLEPDDFRYSEPGTLSVTLPT